VRRATSVEPTAPNTPAAHALRDLRRQGLERAVLQDACFDLQQVEWRREDLARHGHVARIHQLNGVYGGLVAVQLLHAPGVEVRELGDADAVLGD
jgi:hypothetical protein